MVKRIESKLPLGMNKGLMTSLLILLSVLAIATAASAVNIDTCEELQNMTLDLAGDYVLTADIDCSNTSVPGASVWDASGFLPVGNNTIKFTGSFNGNGHTITGLYINRLAIDYVGLFGYANDASISNVRLLDLNITGGTFTGGLVGYATSATNITNCSASGNVSGASFIGGLVGFESSDSLVNTSYADVDIRCSASFCGGLVGRIDYSTIDNSYALSDVTSSSNYVGGLVGFIMGSAGDASIVDRSYATGSVTSTNNGGGDLYVGGLSGGISGAGSSIRNSYATGSVNGTGGVGGLLGVFTSGTIINGHWYNQSGDNAANCYSGGDTNCTAEIPESYFFTITNPPMNAWDFGTVWCSFLDGVRYPVLQWQDECSDITPPSISFITPTPLDGANTTDGNATINVSITESNLGNVTYDWNGANFTVYDDSLVLMMNLDNVSALGENSTYAADVSKYGHNATCTNCPTWDSSGKYGGGYSFNGSQFFSINTSESLNFTSSCAFTQAAWIYPVHGVDGDYHGFMGYQDAQRQPSIWIFNQSRIHFGFNNGSTWCSYLPEDNIISNNDWNYIAVTYNGTHYSAYADGVLFYSNDSYGATCPQSSSAKMDIGGIDNYFNGTIDEVRIWNRSLSASEVYQQYDSNLNKFNQTQWYFYINQSKNATTGTDPGSYTYQACAADSDGNNNCTEERGINILYQCDSLDPPIDMDCPDVTVSYTADAYINVTANFTDCNVAGYNLTIGSGGDVVYDGCMVSFDKVTVQAGGSFMTQNRP